MLTQLRRELESGWTEPGWPANLPPDEAAEVRRFVTVSGHGCLDVFDRLLLAEATAASRATTVAAALMDDAERLTGSTSWKRATVWTVLAIGYLARATNDAWPVEVRLWLREAEQTLLDWLPSSLATDVARAVSLYERRDDATLPVVADMRPPADWPLHRPARHGALTELSRGQRSRPPTRDVFPSPAPSAEPPSPSGGMRGWPDTETASAAIDEPVPPPPPAAAPAAEARRYDVWYGTNRKPGNLAIPSQAFGNERDPDGRVHYGSCSVEIPRTHKFGSMGTAWWRRWARLNFQDDALRLVEIVPFASGTEFFDELRQQMAQLDPNDQQVLVYIHGFNVSFEEAALRAAQIGFDLKVPGITSFFSWPSASNVKSYFADQDRIEASENELAEFLIQMARASGASTVHILAHSMGNRGLARAIQRITARAAREGAVRFGQIILAAPDISVELFRDLAAVYPTLSARTTMYASARDRALAMSGYLQDDVRAGFTPPVTVVNGVDTIEVTDIDLTLLGHGYFAGAEAVLYDIAQLLHAPGIAAARRPRLRAVQSTGAAFWQIGG